MQSRVQRILFWVSLVVLWAQIVPITAILGLSYKDTCDVSLRVFLIMFDVLLLCNVVVTIYHQINPPLNIDDPFERPPTRMGRFMLSFSRSLSFAMILMFFVGSVSLMSAAPCRNTSPKLYWTSMAVILFNVFLMFLPLLLMLSFICCLPCIILLMQRLYPEPNRGATESAIGRVPKFKYSPDQPKYGNVTVLAEDAACSICLQPYTAGIDIRVLSCKHHYHQQCADEWFRISATCPLCVRPIRSASPSSPASPINLSRIA